MNTDEIFQRNEVQSSSSMNLNFTNRQKNLFDSLDKIKTQLNPTENSMSVNETALQTNKRKRSETKHLRGKESIFKRPEEPLSKCLPLRSAPDFKRNPHKWTKYSLSDVKYEELTDKSNTAAALSFLRELEERKQIDSSVAMELDSNITFKKPNSLKFKNSVIARRKIEQDDDKKITFKGSKIVMPEYVVGQKHSKEKKPKTPKEKVDKSKELKLDHLLEEENDNE